MKTYYKIILAFIVLGIYSCKRENIIASTVINSLYISNHTPYADGTTIVKISVAIDSIADPTKSSVIFSTNAGTFLSTNDTIITQAATFQSGHLIANVSLRVPMTVGKIIIKAYPAVSSPYFTFLLKDSIMLVRAVPDQIVLTPSALSIASNFGSEVSLTGALSFQMKNVSTGDKVLFEDYYPGGAKLGGSFRAVKDTSDITSTVSAAYSIGATLPAGTSFFLKCTYLDASGNRTNIKDSTLITVNK